MKSKFYQVLLVIVSILIGTVPLTAQTVHQVAAGDSTLRDAIDAAADGDILELITDGGVYVNPNITLDKSLTIKATPGLIEKPVLRNPNSGGYMFRIDTSASLVFEGLDFDGDGTSVGGDGILKYIFRIETGVALPDPITIKVDDCDFHESSDKLIKPYPNTVIDSMIIHNSTFYNGGKEGIALYSGSSGDPQVNLDYAEIINCTFYNMEREAIKLDTNPNTKLVVDHITCYNISGAPDGQKKPFIYVDDATDVVIKNSVFQKNFEDGNCIRLESDANMVSNCVLWDVNDRDIDNSDSVTDTLWADPLFADPENADFTLGETSPALDFADDGSVAGDVRWDPFKPGEQRTFKIAAGDSTLRDAIDDANDGDIIELTTNGGIYVNPNITLDKSLTIRAASSLIAKPILKNPNSGGYIFRIDTSASLVFEGLDFDGDGTSVGGDGILKYIFRIETGVALPDPITIKVDDCDFHESSDKLIKPYPNTVIDSMIIHNSTFYNGGKEGIALYSGSSGDPQVNLDYAEIINCTFYNMEREAIKLDTNPNTKLVVDHITCYNISGASDGQKKPFIYVDDATDVVIKNSIFQKNFEDGNCIRLESDANMVSNCVLWDVNDRDIDNSDSVTDTLWANPLFADPENADFTLGEMSPALGFADDGSAAGDSRWATSPEGFRLTVLVNGNGTYTVEPEGGPYYAEGTQVTITAIPDQDWKVVSWEGVAVFPPDATEATVTMDDNKTVTINFEPTLEKYSLNVPVIGVGHVDFSPAPLDSSDWTYYEGTEVTMTAVSDTASMEFDGWSGDVVSMDNPLVVTMDSVISVTATFTPVVTQFTLDVDTVGLGNIMYVPEPYADYGTYDSASVVLLIADPLPGYEFTGWSGDVTDAKDSLNVQMDSSIVLTATFEEINVAGGAIEVDTTMALQEAVSFARNNSQVNTLILTTSGGVYPSHENVDVDFPLEIKAKEGLEKKPIIEGNPSLSYASGVFQIRRGGTKLTLDGVEIYGAKYAVRTDDDSLRTEIRINDCYIHDIGEVWVKVYILSYVDSLIITNSIFRETPKEGIYLKEPNTFNYVHLENSTFIRSGREALRARDNIDATVMINHCNFDSMSWNANYRVIYPEDVARTTLKNSIVTNQMFATERHQDFARVYGTSTVSNMVVYNASTQVDPEEDAVVDTTTIWEFDPLFEAAEQMNYTLTEASHAYGVADDGEAAGDLRWATNTPVHVKLTLAIDGDGSVFSDPAPVGLTYDPGTEVTLTANPDSGYVFKEWSGDLTGDTNPASLTLDADKTVTALFVLATSLEDGGLMPTEYALHQNFPNPFNPQTTIKFDIKEAGKTKVVVYDVLGKEIATLVNKKMQPGRYQVTFYNPELSTGLYFYRITSGDYTAIKKMILVK